MASKTKNKGLHKDGSRSKEGLSSKKDGCREDGSSPVSMNGDLEDDQQLWIHAPDDPSNMEKDRKRLSHNVLERRRKDKIKRWVVAIKDLLPKFSLGMEKLSHGDIMEKACTYIKELQDKNDKLLQDCGGEVQAEEIEKLKKELTEVHAERDRLIEIIRNAGLSAMQDPSYQWKSRNQSKPDSTATSMDCEPSCSSMPSDTFVPDISSSSSQKDDESKLAKCKRKNTVSFQLEQTKLQQQQFQEAAAAQAMAGAMFGPGFMGNGGMPLMNQMFPGLGQQVLANQNLLMNSGFANPGTVVMNGNGQMILPMSSAGTGSGVGSGGVQPPGVIFQGDRNMAANGLGLLQLAMQDAGIGPAQSDNSRQPSPVGSTSSDVLHQSKPVSASSSGSDTPNSVSGSTDDINSASALQTLASVASNTQSAAVCSVMSGMPQVPASVVSQTTVGVTNTSAVNSVMSMGQQTNYSQLMQQGNMVVNMPLMNPGQPSAPGMFQNGALGGYGMGNFVINQNGQMIVINEQGMPVMPGMQPSDQQQPQPTPQHLLQQQQQQQQQPAPTSKPAPEKSKSSKKSKPSTSMSNSASVILPSAQEQTDTGAMNITIVSSKSEPIVNSANTITVTASQTQPTVMPPNLSQQQNPMTMFAQQNPMLQPQGLQPMALQGQPQVSLPSGQNVYQQQLNSQLAMNQQVIQNPGLAMPVSQNGNLLTLNTMPSQPNQLPTALILPNGQIIPVVTNAQTVNPQAQSVNGNVQVLSNTGAPSFQYPPQMQPRPGVPSTLLGIDPNNPAAGAPMIIGPNGQIQQTPQQQLQQQQQLLQQQIQLQLQQQQNMGLLLTTTASSQVAQNPVYNCATLSTSVVPTSSTQSVMSTQVQASGTASNVVQTANSMSNPQEVVSNTCSVMSGQEFDPGSKGGSDTVKSLTSSVPPIAPTGVPSAVTNATPQGLVLNQTQTGPQAPVLLSVPMNGQQMNVLIDPVTMQVLATVAPNQNQALAAATTAPLTNTTASTPPSSAGKKSGKKNQRAIFPKPSSTSSKVTSTALPTETAAPPPLTSASPLPSAPASLPEGALSQPTMAVTSTTFSESKANFSSTSTEASTTSVSAAEAAAAAATDILAKAAESIFSPSPSEISPGPSFYNPANEDNPLHIDTSVGDGDEDSCTVSPVKATHDPQSTPSKDTEMAPPQVVPPVQKPPEVPPVLPPVLPPVQPTVQPPVQPPMQPPVQPSVQPSLLTPPTPPAPEQATSTPTKKSKSKSKSKSKNTTTPETGKPESKKSSSKKKKQASAQPPPPPPPPPPPVNTEPEPKVVNMPETIEFSVSQISDVLDQVESFGAPVEPVKKKSRKGKADADGGEPANKKRKRNSTKEKEKVPVSQPQSNKALSVFDFDEDSPPEVSPTRRSLGPLHNQNSLPVSVPPPSRPAPPQAPPQAPTPAQAPNPPTPKAPVELPPLTKEANTAAENFDLLDDVLSQALPLQTEPSTSQPTESVKSPFMHSESNKNMEIGDAQEPCVQSFNGSVSSTPSNPMTDTTSNVSQTSSSSRLSHTDNQIFSKPSPITASSSDDSTHKTSSVSSNLPPKSDLMENAVSSSILSPASAGSAQGQMSDMVVAAISSSGVDALAELTATPSASPSPGALIMETSPTYQPQIDQQLTPQQQPTPQPPPPPPQPTPWQSPPPLQQSPSQSLQVPRPPSHPPQMAAPPPLQQQQPNPSSRPSSQQPAQIHPHNQPSNQSMPNQPSQRSKSANLPPQQQMNYPSSQKSSTMQQSPSSTSMVSPPAPPRSRGGQESQSPFANKGHGQGQVSSFQRSPCHEVPGSADPLFNSPPQVSSMPKLTHPPSSQTSKPMNTTDNSASQRSRNSIYSADNFVQPSRNSGSGETRSQTSSTNVPSSGNGFGRLPTDSTNESFNFTSIGLNLTSSTTSNSLPEALTNSSNSATPFSFSLTPVTTTTTTTTTASSSSGPLPSHNHHQFSFYPLHPPVSQQTPLPPGGTASGSQGGQPNMLALGVDLRLEGSGPPVRHPPNSNIQGQGPFNFHLMDMNSRPSNIPPEPPRISMPEKNAHFSGSANGQKRQANVPPSRTIQGSQSLDHNIPTSQRSPHVNNSGSYYPPNFQTCTASLHTPPLHHHPAQSGESSRLVHPRGPYEANFPSASQSMGSMAFVANRYDPVQGPFNRQCNPPQSFEHSSNPNSDSRKSANQSGSKGSKQPPQQTPPLSHPQSQPQSVISAAPQSHTPSNSHNSSCSSQPPPQSAHPMSQSVAQVRPQKSRKQSKKASKQQQQQQQPQNYNSEMDTNLAHSIFDSNQGLATYFQIPNLPPSPSRNMSNEGPSFLSGNLFGAGGRPISNSGPGMHKNAELGPPFNSLFPPSRAQNGLGLNFQHTFGMNPGNPSNGPQLGSHSGGVSLTPHMPNFSLGNLNFLSEVNSGGQNDSLNISPIKFPHGNTILPQAGMDHNSLQHAHQGSSLYHQRGQPPQPHVIHNAMSINSILGHNPHGFDVRPMGQPINSSVTPPFHGAGHPGSFSMPPLNFSMHEH